MEDLPLLFLLVQGCLNFVSPIPLVLERPLLEAVPATLARHFLAAGQYRGHLLNLSQFVLLNFLPQFLDFTVRAVAVHQ